MRVITAVLVLGSLLVGAAAVYAQQKSTLYTQRGYPYDAGTCSGGYPACFGRYQKAGWQNAAAASYCQQACRDFKQSPW